MECVLCSSDSLDSNKKIPVSDIRPKDILSPNDPDAMDKNVAEIDKERDDLMDYREKVKRYKSRSLTSTNVNASPQTFWSSSTPRRDNSSFLSKGIMDANRRMSPL